jgi:hypothetical protein
MWNCRWLFDNKIPNYYGLKILWFKWNYYGSNAISLRVAATRSSSKRNLSPGENSFLRFSELEVRNS